VDERLRFVARLLEGEKMGRCAASSYLSPDGHKFISDTRSGPSGPDRSLSRPYARPTAYRAGGVLIVQLRKSTQLGVPKIARRSAPGSGISLPAIQPPCTRCRSPWARTAGRRRCTTRHRVRPLSRPTRPNALWCPDYKGEFMLADRALLLSADPSDFRQRYLLCCEACTAPRNICFCVSSAPSRNWPARRPSAATTACFRQPRRLLRLSKLSVWCCARHWHRAHQARSPTAKRRHNACT